MFFRILGGDFQPPNPFFFIFFPSLGIFRVGFVVFGVNFLGFLTRFSSLSVSKQRHHARAVLRTQGRGFGDRFGVFGVNFSVF